MKRSPFVASRLLGLAAAGAILVMPAFAQKIAPPPAADSVAEDSGWDSQPAVGESAGLSFSKTEYDWGTISEGEKVEVEFPFVNQSDRTLTVTQVRTTCGCTAAELAQKTFQPGQGSVIKVTFNSAGREGAQQKMVSVATDDPKNPMYTLKLSGQIFSEVSLSRKAIDFGDIEQGQERSEVFELIDLSETPIEITRVDSSAPGLDIKVGTAREHKDPVSGREGHVTPITVTVPASYPSGRVQTSVVVQTNHKSRQNFVLGLNGRVVGEVEFEPPNMFFGVVPPGGTSERLAALKVRSGKDFVLESFEVENVGSGAVQKEAAQVLTAAIEKDEAEGGQALKAVFTAPEIRGTYRGSLILKGKLEGKDVAYQLPFTAVVRDSPVAVPPSASGETQKLKIENGAEQIRAAAPNVKTGMPVKITPAQIKSGEARLIDASGNSKGSGAQPVEEKREEGAPAEKPKSKG